MSDTRTLISLQVHQNPLNLISNNFYLASVLLAQRKVQSDSEKRGQF